MYERSYQLFIAKQSPPLFQFRRDAMTSELKADATQSPVWILMSLMSCARALKSIYHNVTPSLSLSLSPNVTLRAALTRRGEKNERLIDKLIFALTCVTLLRRSLAFPRFSGERSGRARKITLRLGHARSRHCPSEHTTSSENNNREIMQHASIILPSLAARCLYA